MPLPISFVPPQCPYLMACKTTCTSMRIHPLINFPFPVPHCLMPHSIACMLQHTPPLFSASDPLLHCPDDVQHTHIFCRPVHHLHTSPNPNPPILPLHTPFYFLFSFSFAPTYILLPPHKLFFFSLFYTPTHLSFLPDPAVNAGGQPGWHSTHIHQFFLRSGPSLSFCTQTQLSVLEMKLGLVHLVETLNFLHTEAGLAHCGLTPQVLLPVLFLLEAQFSSVMSLAQQARFLLRASSCCTQSAYEPYF